MTRQITNDIFWVGAVDWNVRDFHGYETNNGSTYNAYFINDEKKVLVDTVKYLFKDTLLNNIKDALQSHTLDYIVCNHAEPDHSSALPFVINTYPNAKIICNQKCKDTLSLYYDTQNWNFHIVKDGDSLNIGTNTLYFYDTPMVHWPESMVTYVPNQKLLFSMDILGQHYASSCRFDYEENLETLLYEARKYYANIVMPYAKQVLNTLEKLKKLEIEIVANSHGLILKKYLPQMLSLYSDFANGVNNEKALIIYDTMWQSTEKMAYSLINGLSTNTNLKIKVCNLKSTHNTIVATEAIDAKYILVGSPTLNSHILPTVASALTYLEGLKPQNKTALCFGSYGWAPVFAKKITEYFERMNFNIFCEPITCKFKPTDEVLKTCFETGKKLSQN